MSNEIILTTERNVLACIIIENKHLDKVVHKIQVDDFTELEHRQIYSTMLANRELNLVNDYTTILSTSQKQGYELDIIKLINMSELLPTAENVDSYVSQLKEQSNTRKLRSVIEDITVNDKLSSKEISEKLIDVIDRLDYVTNENVKKIGENIKSYLDKIADGVVADIYKTLYTKLDSRVKVKKGNLTIIAGRPGSGKSAYMLNIILNYLLQKLKVVVFSLEMTEEEMLDRIISMLTGLEHDRVSARESLTPKELTMLYSVEKQIEEMDLYVFDKGGLKIENLLNICKELKRQNKLDVLFLDHIGLVKTNKYRGNKVQEAGYVSNVLKEIAMDLKIPVFALSQLNRNVVDSNTGKMREPTLSDLKNTGNIEEDANIVLLLHSESDEYDAPVREVKLRIAKNRGGKLGSVIMHFKTNLMKFVETERDTGVEIPITKLENIFEEE